MSKKNKSNGERVWVVTYDSGIVHNRFVYFTKAIALSQWPKPHHYITITPARLVYDKPAKKKSKEK